MEATLLLATIAQRFHLRSVPDHPVVAIPSFTLRPKDGIRMTVESRPALNRDATQELQSSGRL